MATRVHTEAIITQLIISADDNVTLASVICISGTCTVQGSFTFQGRPSTPITLSAGQGVVLPAAIASPLDGIVITPIGGTTNMALQFN